MKYTVVVIVVVFSLCFVLVAVFKLFQWHYRRMNNVVDGSGDVLEMNDMLVENPHAHIVDFIDGGRNNDNNDNNNTTIEINDSGGEDDEEGRVGCEVQDVGGIA